MIIPGFDQAGKSLFFYKNAEFRGIGEGKPRFGANGAAPCREIVPEKRNFSEK